MLVHAQTGLKNALLFSFRFKFHSLPIRQRQELCDRSPAIGGVSKSVLFLISFGLCLGLSGCIGDVVSRSTPLTLVASANSINLGSVPVGKLASATLSLVNKNPVAVNITQLSLTGQPFSVSGQYSLPVSVAAGSTYTLGINFYPAVAGQATGQLTIATDASADGAMVIGLSGIGAEISQPSKNLSAIACATGSITGTGTDACTVTISGAAPSGGFKVNLSSNNSAVNVPATVTIPANANSVPFTANASSVLATQSVTLTASASGNSENFTLNLNAYVPTLKISSTNLSFGNVPLNTGATYSVTLTSAGTAPVTISAASLTGEGFSLSGDAFPQTLNPNNTATLSVQFNPNAPGASKGQLTISSNASTNATAVIALSGTGLAPPAVSLSASSLTFPGERVGVTSASQSVTLSNTGTGPLAITSIAVTGADASSFAFGNSCGTSVAGGANCTIHGHFTPAATGALAAAVTITDNASNSPQSISLSGTDLSLSAVTLSANSLSFGSVEPGATSASQSVTLTNTGTGPLAITSIAVTGADASSFEFANSCGTSVAAGANCTIHGHFTPAATDALTAAVTITDNAPSSPQSISLSGTGTPPASVLTTFSCGTGSITGSGTDACTVTLSAAAPIAGLSVNLSSNNAAVTVPGTVTVPANAASAEFTATVSSVSTAQAVTLTASSGSISKSFSLQLSAALPAPTFSPAAGTYLKSQTVSISCSNKNAVVYYTTDGSSPTPDSTRYSGRLTVSSNQTISAMALVAGGTESAVSRASYTITPPAAKPVFSLADGKYTSVQKVEISDVTTGASIYYTTDGSAPTVAATLYSGPINVEATQIIEAVALAPEGSLSPVAMAAYTITVPTEAPVISPPSGTYNSIQSVTIADSTPNAVIYYTVNGRAPTYSSPIYNGPITATTNTTVQAIAVAPGDSATSFVDAQYTIIAPPPIISPASGTYETTATVTMSDSAPGAVIHYTSDGSTPTTSSPVYTGAIKVSPEQTTTEVFQAIAVAAGYLQSSSTVASFSVTLPSGVLAQAIVNTTPQMTIPPNFMGLSMDWRSVSPSAGPFAIMGQESTGVNHIFRTLLNNITEYYTAPMLIRIEADDTQVSDIQGATEPLAELAQAANVNYTLGVDLWNNNSTLTEAETSTWVNGIPKNFIQAIEIGNEPDNYQYQGARPSGYAFDDYLPQFQEWQQGVQSSAGYSIGIMGPSTGSSGWNAASESGFAAETFTPSIVSQHAYLNPAPAGQTTPSDYLLEPASVNDLPSIYAPYAVSAHQAGHPFRMGEINSVWGGGIAGISDTFSSTLWSIDIMFHYLSSGVDGVNWHTGQYTNYALFEFKRYTYDGPTTYTVEQVNPLYYGLLVFAQLTGRGARLLPVQTMTDANLAIWATVDNTSTVHLIVINKDEAATGDVRITIPGYTKGTVRYLCAANYSSTNGVTFGGQTFDGTTDGTIQGQLVTTKITAQDSTFTLPNMPITTAAVIDLSN